MLGYVIINKNELKDEELELYNGYYCGVCKSIGKRHGQFPRLALSYDIVFLALILSSLNEFPLRVEKEHCILHPIDRKPVVYDDAAVDYAADMLLILAYHNFLDDKKDEHRVRGALGSSMLKGSYQVLAKSYPDICSEIEKNIEKLSELEKEKSGSLDLTCEAFGKVLESVFMGYNPPKDDSPIASLISNSEKVNSENEKNKRILSALGLALGKWIYLMDAMDDFEKDKKSGSYNPLIYREKEREGVEELIYNYLGDISKAVDLLDIRKNNGIIDNIIWNGLRARTDMILERMTDGSI